MSSTGAGGLSRYAIDGDLNTRWGTGTPAKYCAHSGAAAVDTLPYWAQDFGQDVNVTAIIIYVRTDSERG